MTTGSETKKGGSTIKSETAASEREFTQATTNALKEALGKEAEKAPEAIAWMENASTEDKIEVAEHIFRDPVKAVVLGQMSKEKADLIKFLHENGEVLEENTYQTGTAGTYQVGRNIIKVTGLEVKTNLKASKSKAQYLGMTGQKRWYGGGSSLKETAKTQTFTVFHKAQVEALIKKYSK